MSTKNRTRRTTTRNIRFPNQTFEQINIALGAKSGPWIFSLGHWSSLSETNVRKESAYTSIKSMKNEHPGSSSEQDDIVNSLNYEGIAVIELQFYHFPDSDRLVRVGSVTD